MLSLDHFSIRHETVISMATDRVADDSLKEQIELLNLSKLDLSVSGFSRSVMSMDFK